VEVPTSTPCSSAPYRTHLDSSRHKSQHLPVARRRLLVRLDHSREAQWRNANTCAQNTKVHTVPLHRRNMDPTYLAAHEGHLHSKYYPSTYLRRLS
jgi:hypothetical protein